MMRTCPKCGDYYADELLAFCLADGTPLVNVEPFNENWSEGTRIIEEKEKTLRAQQRRLKWRRILLSLMTMLIATMIVCVVAVNGLIYLSPTPNEEPAPAPASSQTLTPPVPIEPVKLKIKAPPPPLKFKIKAPPPPPPPPPPPKCSVADKRRERKSIIDKYDAEWQRQFAADQQKIIARNKPDGATNAEARLSPIKYDVTFAETCATGFVTARYEWVVTAKINETTAFNGVPMPRPVSYEKRLGQQRNFRCVKSAGAWLCR